MLSAGLFTQTGSAVPAVSDARYLHSAAAIAGGTAYVSTYVDRRRWCVVPYHDGEILILLHGDRGAAVLVRGYVGGQLHAHAIAIAGI